jgi:hypothetical protein
MKDPVIRGTNHFIYGYEPTQDYSSQPGQKTSSTSVNPLPGSAESQQSEVAGVIDVKAFLTKARDRVDFETFRSFLTNVGRLV